MGRLGGFGDAFGRGRIYYWKERMDGGYYCGKETMLLWGERCVCKGTLLRAWGHYYVEVVYLIMYKDRRKYIMHDDQINHLT